MPENQRPSNAGGLSLLTTAGFWGSLSMLVSLISLALPWWEVDTIPDAIASPSWGVFWGPAPPTQLRLVTFFPNRLDQALSTSYSIEVSLVVLTLLLTILGSYIRRWPFLAGALLSSVATDLSYVAVIRYALDSECL